MSREVLLKGLCYVLDTPTALWLKILEVQGLGTTKTPGVLGFSLSTAAGSNVGSSHLKTTLLRYKWFIRKEFRYTFLAHQIGHNKRQNCQDFPRRPWWTSLGCLGSCEKHQTAKVAPVVLKFGVSLFGAVNFHLISASLGKDLTVFSTLMACWEVELEILTGSWHFTVWILIGV